MIVTRVSSINFNTTEIDTMKYLAKLVDLQFVTFGDPNTPLAIYNRSLCSKYGIKVVQVTNKNAINVFPMTVGLFTHFFKEQTDIILTTEWYYAYDALLSLFFNSKTFCYSAENIYKKRKLAHALRKFSRLIVPVNGTKEVWLKVIPKERINVIPYGVDVDMLTPDGFTFEKPRILYTGRIVESKGIGYLIQALAKLPFDFEARIVGKGEIKYFSQMTQELGIADKVQFPGWMNSREELLDCYKWCNIFVQPSITTYYWKEQMGCSLFEAMACGRIVIGSDSGSIPEVIGDAGIIVRERSEDELAKAIVAVTESKDYARLLARRARAKAEKDYDARKCAEAFYAVFECTLNR